MTKEDLVTMVSVDLLIATSLDLSIVTKEDLLTVVSVDLHIVTNVDLQL